MVEKINMFKEGKGRGFLILPSSAKKPFDSKKQW